MQFTPLRPAALSLTLLAACVATPAPEPGPLADPPVVDPAGAACLSRATTPAIIETVTEQVMVQPAVVDTDGTVRSPAVFRTVTRQQILRERREVEFEVPCPPLMTPEFIASVQRALKARGFYRGPTTGVLDPATSRAVQAYQVSIGDVDTGQLTLKAARSLGLVALPRDEL